MISSNCLSASSDGKTWDGPTRTTGPKLLVRSSYESKGRITRKIPIFQGSAAKDQATASAPSVIFRQHGDFWTLSYDGHTVCLKDVRGLAYIARLLSQPYTEIHAIELSRMGISGDEPSDRAVQSSELENAGMQIGYLGDAGEMLDDQAKAAYRRRLSELREELAGARAAGEVQRAEAAELEIDALIGELSRATGLAGRDRVAASSSERARQSVTRAIRTALGRIADYHPSLGHLLARQIRTGTYCSYQPDADDTLQWSLSGPASDETSFGTDKFPVTVPCQVQGKPDHWPCFSQVLDMILAPLCNASETVAETGEGRDAVDAVAPVLRGPFLQLSSQLKSSEWATPMGNIIVVVVNSASLPDGRRA